MQLFHDIMSLNICSQITLSLKITDSTVASKEFEE